MFGFDFPFGLPAALVSESSWETFVLRFPDRYPDVTGFRQARREAAGGREWKRRTDLESKTPFSPYNLRLFRQTYYGIRDLLHPMIAAGLASVVTVQSWGKKPAAHPILAISGAPKRLT